jgi:Na+/proline symporter
MDFYRLVRPQYDEKHYLRLARYATLAWGAVLFTIGYLSRNVKSVLEAGLGIASILYGALLGVFLLGLTTKRVGEGSAMAGMTAGILINLFVRFGTDIAWTWYVLIGTVVTYSTAILASLATDRKESVHG